jgi:ABC-type transport system involved in multi-copper enzyme maturation permease subunit
MTIVGPSYSMAPQRLEPHLRRVQTILTHQIREQAGVLNFFLVAILMLIGVLPITLNFYLLGATGIGLLGSSGLAAFFWPIGQELWFFLLILLISSAGAAVIARDVATKAMTMYLARPITPVDYLAAKSAAVGFWIFLGAIVPGCIGAVIVLGLGYVSLAVALEAVAAYLVVGLFAIAVFSGLAVLVSSLTPRTTIAGAGIFGSLLGSYVVLSVIAGISGRSGFLYASPVNDVVAVGAGVFGASGDPLDPWSAGAILIALAVATLALTYIRLLRTQEVSE